ncbi:hypothetical protein F3J11_20760 [Burkholderia sp. Cy-647]|nr:hypothetical protein [Burkholderia sp. Cy-647]
MADIVIVASAYGTEAIRRDGHRAYVGRAAEAGAAGFEVRRELFAADEDCAPAALAAQCALAALPVPSPAQWAALGGFERYVLAKLSRKPKLNHDFVPAMREFGLAGA